MNKKTDYSVYIVILIAIAIVIYLAFSSFPTQTIMSVSNINLESEADLFDESAYVITFTQGSISAQEIFGVILNDDDFDELGVDTDGSFAFGVDWDEQACIYDISERSGSEPVYDYAVKTGQDDCTDISSSDRDDLLEDFIDKSGIDEDLIIGTGHFAEGGTWLNDYTCYIVYKDKEYSSGTFNDNGNVRISGTMTMEVDDGDGNIETDQRNFDSTSTENDFYFCESTGSSCDVNSDDVFGWVDYQGSLVIKNCEGISDVYRPFYDQDKNSWITIYEADYGDYLNEVNDAESGVLTIISRDIENGDITSSRLEDIVESNLNEELIEKVLDIDKDKTSEVGDIEDESSISNSQLVEVLEGNIYNPMASLYVKASYVGVRTLVPDLELVDYEDSQDCVSTGDDGNIAIEIKNNGDANAEVDITVECSDGFDGQSETTTIKAGQTKTIYADYNVDVSTDTVGECNVRIREPVSGFNELVKSDVCGESIGLACSAKGTTYCGEDDNNYEAVISCSSDGLDEEIIEVCAGDETCVESASSASCVSEDEITIDVCVLDPTDVSCEDEKDCSDSYFSWLWLDCTECDSKLTEVSETFDTYCKLEEFDITGILGVLFGILLSGFLILFLTKNFPQKKIESKVGIWIVSIVAGIIAFILFQYWWIILIIVGMAGLVLIIGKKYVR